MGLFYLVIHPRLFSFLLGRLWFWWFGCYFFIRLLIVTIWECPFEVILDTLCHLSEVLSRNVMFLRLTQLLFIVRYSWVQRYFVFNVSKHLHIFLMFASNKIAIFTWFGWLCSALLLLEKAVHFLFGKSTILKCLRDCNVILANDLSDVGFCF